MENLIAYLDAQRGRRVALAQKLGIRPGAISQWKIVPLARVRDVARVTGIPAHELRPDVFPAPLPVAAIDIKEPAHD